MIIIPKMITFYFFSNINSCFFLVCFQFIFSPSSLCIFFLFYSIYFFSFNSCFVFSLQKPTWANMSFLGCGLIYRLPFYFLKLYWPPICYIVSTNCHLTILRNDKNIHRIIFTSFFHWDPLPKENPKLIFKKPNSSSK